MQLDHVSYAVLNSELADTVQRLGSELGAAFIDGGKHPRFGTRNFILPIAGGSYIEVVTPLDHPAADAAPFGRAVRQRAEAGGGWMGWAVRVNDLTAQESALGREAGLGHRVRPDGSDVRWRQIGVLDLIDDPALPFFIRWDEDSEHPSMGGNEAIAIDQVCISGDQTSLASWLGNDSADLLDTLNVCFVDEEDAGLASIRFTTPNGEVTID